VQGVASAGASWPAHVRVSATHRRSGASASVTLPLVAGFRLASDPEALSTAGGAYATPGFVRCTRGVRCSRRAHGG